MSAIVPTGGFAGCLDDDTGGSTTSPDDEDEGSTKADDDSTTSGTPDGEDSSPEDGDDSGVSDENGNGVDDPIHGVYEVTTQTKGCNGEGEPTDGHDYIRIERASDTYLLYLCNSEDNCEDIFEARFTETFAADANPGELIESRAVSTSTQSNGTCVLEGAGIELEITEAGIRYRSWEGEFEFETAEEAYECTSNDPEVEQAHLLECISADTFEGTPIP